MACIKAIIIIVTWTKLIIKVTTPILDLYLVSILFKNLLTNLAINIPIAIITMANTIAGSFSVKISIYLVKIVVCFSIVFSKNLPPYPKFSCSYIF